MMMNRYVGLKKGNVRRERKDEKEEMETNSQ
jgi:hypothetical protein